MTTFSGKLGQDTVTGPTLLLEFESCMEIWTQISARGWHSSHAIKLVHCLAFLFGLSLPLPWRGASSKPTWEIHAMPTPAYITPPGACVFTFTRSLLSSRTGARKWLNRSKSRGLFLLLISRMCQNFHSEPLILQVYNSAIKTHLLPEILARRLLAGF